LSKERGPVHHNMKIIIGSGSERKIKMAQKVASQLFLEAVTVIGYPAKSGVSDTPWDQDTCRGAKNRALDVQKHQPGAQYYLGLESGLIERYGHIYEEAWAAVIDQDGKEFYGYSSGLKVPDFILKKMDDLKMEHCDVMTIIERDFADSTTLNETWGNYSGGAILREISLEEALRNALIQVTAPDHSFYHK